MNLIEFLERVFIYQTKAPLLFNSNIFMFLYIMVLVVYAGIYRNNLSRTLFLLSFSLFFYYKSSGLFVLLLIFTLFLVFYITRIMNTREGKERKLWLLFSLISSLGFLAYFKYTNFFWENICALSGGEFKALNIFLPVGISFYTFQLLSYVIDVYRKEMPVEKSFINYAFYISFFPQLVAGPIVRASLFLPQLREKINISAVEIEKGFFLILQGLVKKALIADYLAQYNDMVFQNPAGYSGFENLLAIYGYAIQIYCDFSGYSDMAIGMGKMMGFDLGINFIKPYQATSITDFWRRWHISLSSWLRDYLYIPLGGNRKGKYRTYINLMVTMLIGGLWHGANWKFVFWGALHGIGLAVHKLWAKLTKGVFRRNPIGKTLGWLLTLHFVVFLWVFFRAQSFESAWLMLGQVVNTFDWAYLAPFWNTRSLFLILLFAAVAIHAIPASKFSRVEDIYVRIPFVFKAVAFIVLIQIILQVRSESVQPFIYFQF